MRSLIVDDDAVCRKLLVAALATLGPLQEAPSGCAAVEAVHRALLADAPYDLITLDVMMPDMDGQSALVAIRSLEGVKGFREGTGAVILMTSAVGDGENVLSAFREQCNGCLTKPIDLERLYSVLSEHGLYPADAG